MRSCPIAGQWPSGRTAPGLSPFIRCFGVQPSPYQHSAKYSSATLGTTVKPCSRRSRPHLTKPTIPLSKAYQSGQTKLSRRPGKGAASGASILASYHPDTPLSVIKRATTQLSAGAGIPNEHDVLTALVQCDKAASLVMSASTGQVSRSQDESGNPASSLLHLDGSLAEPTQRLAEEVSDTGAGDLIDQISQAALEIIVHPSVVITLQVLEAYVALQARLGRPETLPHVLGLYASKPKPQSGSTSPEYAQEDPDKAANAVDPSIIERALDAAIEARNLDAAVGIIENSYATKAFIKQKLLRKALLPASVAATTPVAIYLVASHLAQLQSSFDEKTATVVAAAGLMAYVGVTGSMGLMAFLTQNDHMRRVTWAPGIALRERWLHEEQRAAFDKVACSFGFSQASRFGEEEGAEFQALREFVLRRGMVLDRIETMEGMK